MRPKHYPYSGKIKKEPIQIIQIDSKGLANRLTSVNQESIFRMKHRLSGL